VLIALPPLGFDVLDMGMPPQGDIGNRFANVMTVFKDRIAIADRGDRNLMAQGYIVAGCNRH
jgi:hypothetical protein